MSWPLLYVCKWCGATVGSFPNVRTDEPATMSVCAAAECRAEASAAYHAPATTSGRFTLA